MVPLQTQLAVLAGPSAVAVHDDGDVLRETLIKSMRRAGRIR
jgi:hypothetical protein